MGMKDCPKVHKVVPWGQRGGEHGKRKKASSSDGEERRRAKKGKQPREAPRVTSKRRDRAERVGCTNPAVSTHQASFGTAYLSTSYHPYH
jgi:hypothetical protein